jgi:hypothetical protein
MHKATSHSLCKISADLRFFHTGHWLDKPLVSQPRTRKWLGRSRAALTSPAPLRATDWFHFNDGHYLWLQWSRHIEVSQPLTVKPPLCHGGYRPSTSCLAVDRKCVYDHQVGHVKVALDLLRASVKANPHVPCRAPAILRQCRVLCESPRGSWKYSNC